MRKILITGSNGMVGRNVAEFGETKDYILLTPKRAQLDLLNKEAVYEYLEENKPDIVIHCAGMVGGIHANMADPINFLVNNMQMGLNIVMGSKEAGVKELLNLGSSCMYPRLAPNPLKEEYILTGELEQTNEGYALAKSAIAKLCEYINRDDNSFLYKTVIPCNLYGKYDKFDEKSSHMLPAVIRKIYEAKINNKKSVEIWGSGEVKREALYASDLADFIYYAIENINNMPQNINVGPGIDCTINEYYEVISEVIGFDGSFTHDLSKPVGVKQKVTDITRLQKFGWSQKTSLRNGIKETYEFYLKNF